ncbi:MAG: N5-carboxyaminoimidazole ribonucleotide mutase [Alphaproteobacteria bacterium MarineAlpha9_Bin3]|nr:MAG: N5-carboxyaminoimidazole ribonucleotide mutase [Alphaproteobacteria bacterium MarineAlpha9_Bin3]|tara:strand:- start:8176 stop:8676 length:501 start_codon:yes stop_codon:yes gene_type:complete
MLKQKKNTDKVGVIMGSQSDWDTMKMTVKVLDKLSVPYEVNIVSAHRTPERLYNYAKSAKNKNIKVIIAGAGGAAHLPGMIASLTHIPVFGVPILSKALSGMDSLLSIVQMPSGIPVGTLAIGDSGACNAGIMAAQILALNNKNIERKVKNYRLKQTKSVNEEPEI